MGLEIPSIDTDSESSEVSNKLESDRSFLIEERRNVLETVRQLLNKGVDLAEENIENDGFYETFINLVKPLIEEIAACKEALDAKTQQQTWRPPRNRRLPFLLD